MPAGIDITNGVAKYAGSREPAWHRLGVTSETDLTIAEGFELGRLAGWDVQLEPIQAIRPARPQVKDPETGDILVPGRKRLPNVDAPKRMATVALDPDGDPRVLGVVSPKYTVIQNEEVGEFLSLILDDERTVLDACGSLEGGTRVFTTLRLGEDIVVPNTDGDAIRPYLIGAWAHDGSMSVRTMLRPIRVVCQNTLNAALGDHTAPTFNVQHTGKGVQGRVQDARAALEIGFNGLDTLTKVAGEWAARSYTDKEFDNIVADFFPVREGASEPVVKRVNEKRDAFRVHATTGEHQTAIAGTAWGVLNAWTEFHDWIDGTRDTDARAQIQMKEAMWNTDDRARVAAASIVAKRLKLARV